MTKIDKKILIVEDEDSIRKVMVSKFEHEGFEVLEAPNGQLGLDLALEKHPDIILLDLVLPKMDGITVLKKLRQDPDGRHIPIIILTNLSDDHNIAEAMAGGVYDFLVKASWDTDDVVKRVKERLEIN